MTHKVLVVYPQKCTGCRICEQWCSMTHFGVVNPAKARITVNRLHERYLNMPVACTQCDDAPCIEVCPEEAISRHPDTFGLILEEEAWPGAAACAPTTATPAALKWTPTPTYPCCATCAAATRSA